MKYLKSVILPLSLFCLFLNTKAVTYHVLFLGNSYTYVNDLPQLVADVALSNGDTVIFDSYTPGGYTLQNHFNDASSLAKIALGGWDFVVLQEQSQLPSFPIGQVQISVYPFAHALDSVIDLYNPCAETMFYMTWGRKNGDASNCSSWPPVCTYEGMDSLLNLRYRTMAFDNNATVSAVGAVWNNIRQNDTTIELYQTDESHPSLAGSYAAACSFYSSIFRKDPTTISYSALLDSTKAASIRNAAKVVVFDAMNLWYIGAYDPKSDYAYVNSGINAVTFQNNSINATDYLWDFNDGSTSITPNPTHIFSAPGLYDISLISNNCNHSDTVVNSVTVLNTGINENAITSDFAIFPNPATDIIKIQTLNENNLLTHIELKNTLGETVFSKKIEYAVNFNIDTQGLPKGYYFLIITSKNNSLKSFPLVLN